MESLPLQGALLRAYHQVVEQRLRETPTPFLLSGVRPVRMGLEKEQKPKRYGSHPNDWMCASRRSHRQQGYQELAMPQALGSRPSRRDRPHGW